MKITRLRLLGFKSFVEPTELLVEPGLTGVVGPNGCGKSNLLEALRWAMGETSYKSMRGTAMEDVIFAGSEARPARNSAEVMLTIANDDRTAPAAFNDADVLEVSRKIAREEGSTYRINGREVRARDVQILFADAATGVQFGARKGTLPEPPREEIVFEDWERTDYARWTATGTAFGSGPVTEAECPDYFKRFGDLGVTGARFVTSHHFRAGGDELRAEPKQIWTDIPGQPRGGP